MESIKNLPDDIEKKLLHKLRLSESEKQTLEEELKKSIEKKDKDDKLSKIEELKNNIQTLENQLKKYKQYGYIGMITKEDCEPSSSEELQEKGAKDEITEVIRKEKGALGQSRVLKQTELEKELSTVISIFEKIIELLNSMDSKHVNKDKLEEMYRNIFTHTNDRIISARDSIEKEQNFDINIKDKYQSAKQIIENELKKYTQQSGGTRKRRSKARTAKAITAKAAKKKSEQTAGNKKKTAAIKIQAMARKKAAAKKAAAKKAAAKKAAMKREDAKKIQAMVNKKAAAKKEAAGKKIQAMVNKKAAAKPLASELKAAQTPATPPATTPPATTPPATTPPATTPAKVAATIPVATPPTAPPTTAAPRAAAPRAAPPASPLAPPSAPPARPPAPPATEVAAKEVAKAAATEVKEKEAAIKIQNIVRRRRRLLKNDLKRAVSKIKSEMHRSGGKKSKKRKNYKFKNVFSHKLKNKTNKKNKNGGKLIVRKPQITVTDAIYTFLKNKKYNILDDLKGNKYFIKKTDINKP